MCRDYRIVSKDKRVRIVRYIDYDLGEEVEDMAKYIADKDYYKSKLYLRRSTKTTTRKVRRKVSLTSKLL
jgi:hypothetical protein